MFRLFIITCTMFIATPALCQDEAPVQFYDVIDGDSVVMYYNDRFYFTGRKCGVNKRYTRVDNNGDFFQYFKDVDEEGKLLATGSYIDGMKNGDFKLYYSNGVVKCMGRYKNNLPEGEWNYFYANGKPERTLTFHVKDDFLDPLMSQFYDPQGNQLVKDGNGYFNGITYEGTQLSTILAKGKIVNGAPDSTWTSERAQQTYHTEFFKNGKFIKGISPKTILRNETEYKDDSKLYDFFYGQYFSELEKFRITKCYDAAEFAKETESDSAAKKDIKYDLSNFRSFVKDAIGSVLDNDQRNGNIRDYQNGDNKCIISFIVGEEGVPKDFKQITSWGDQYNYAITRALAMHARFPGVGRKIFFNLTVNLNGGNTFNYGYNFSYD